MTSAISSSAGTQQSWQVRPHDDERKQRMDKAMSGVADLLGMSVDDIRTAQKNGTTLADLAKQKGVSEDDLESTLAKGLKENAPTDAPSDIDFTQMASDIANGKRPQGAGGHHGHGHKPPESDGTNSATALQSLLQNNGIDSSEFENLLSGGSTSSSGDSTSDFATQLKSLISQYGSKGLSYDTKL